MNYRQAGDRYIFGDNPDKDQLSVSITRLNEVAERLSSFEVIDGASIASPTCYEVAVRLDRAVMGRRFRDEPLSIHDPQAGLSYELGRSSLEYLLYLLLYLEKEVGPRWMPHYLFFSRYRNLSESDSDALEVFQELTPALLTVRVTSSSQRSRKYWKPYIDGFLFHFSYNLDWAIMPEYDFEQLAGRSRFRRMRRSSPQELEAPRRHYVSDLVHHYRLGVSSESPMLEYLSYYHVAEHWFENVYHDDLIARVQGLITDPGFSHRRKNDVRKLIRSVTRAVQLRDEELVISSEQAALKLTLEKYIVLSDLKDDIHGFRPDLIRFYAQNKVPFSDGDVVDLESRDHAKVLTALSNRIYKTRNALVHSKEGGRGKFTPFVDDADLNAEIPLVRFVAERIIIMSSELPPVH